LEPTRHTLSWKWIIVSISHAVIRPFPKISSSTWQTVTPCTHVRWMWACSMLETSLQPWENLLYQS
jgi:hypothetical protein